MENDSDWKFLWKLPESSCASKKLPVESNKSLNPSPARNQFWNDGRFQNAKMRIAKMLSKVPKAIQVHYSLAALICSWSFVFVILQTANLIFINLGAENVWRWPHFVCKAIKEDLIKLMSSGELGYATQIPWSWFLDIPPTKIILLNFPTEMASKYPTEIYEN